MKITTGVRTTRGEGCEKRSSDSQKRKPEKPQHRHFGTPLDMQRRKTIETTHRSRALPECHAAWNGGGPLRTAGRIATMIDRARQLSRRATVANRAVICIVVFAANGAIALALASGAVASIGSNATVGCAAIAPSVEPPQPPRPANAAPLQYPANEGQDPSTFMSPAAVFAKFRVSETTPPLRLKSCRLERWFQTSAARTGEDFVIAPRRQRTLR